VKRSSESATGAWLVLGGLHEPPSATPLPASEGAASGERELSRIECLALASALLAWRPRQGSSLLDLVSEAVRTAGLSEGAVVQWAAGQASRTNAADTLAPSDPLEVVEQLGHAIRVIALPFSRSPEADLLVRALQRTREHLGLLVRFDEQLAEARLEAVRQLAYGAGHEINNPLANIATRGQSLLRDEPDLERRRKLATIVDQAFRARDMIGGLMVFAKPPVALLAEVDLGSLAQSVVGSVCDLPAAEGVDVSVSMSPEPVSVRVDAQMVAEALQALVMNAVEAVPAGGRVCLGVHAGGGKGFHAVVVDDNGPGIATEGWDVACDPFHCGREAGRGLGIGLSKAWALVRACGGRLLLGSRDGGGMSVRVEFPAVAGPSELSQEADAVSG
jgi:signal transduction histidine kinase